MATEKPKPTTLSDAVQQARERWDVPGIAAALLHDGEVETAVAGVTSLETEQPVTSRTLFQIGSITKVFTATLIMQLVDEGRLDLEEPIATYLPDLRLADEAAQRTITLGHLLSHTSGIEGDRFENPHGSGDDALSRAVASFPEFPQLTPPGELWAYCNSGFYLAAAVIERLLGTTYEAAVRERIFEPLGLSRSFFFAHEAITFPVAVGHNQAPGEAPEIARAYPLPRFASAAGAIISTVEDLLRFAVLHLDGGRVDGAQLLSEASARLMQTPRVRAANFALAYGVGWAIFREGKLTVVGHGGATNGFRAQLILVPAQRLALALLANSDRGGYANEEIEAWVLSEVLGVTPRPPATISLPPAELARFAGRYRTRYGRIGVTPQDDCLQVDLAIHYPPAPKETVLPPMRLRPVSAVEFVVTEGDEAGSRSDFILNSDGTPRFLRIGGRLAAPIDETAAVQAEEVSATSPPS